MERRGNGRSVFQRLLSICLALAMLLSFVPAFAPEVSAADTKTIYFVPDTNYWNQANAWFEAWVWGSSSNGDWVRFNETSQSGVYSAEVLSDSTMMIFMRKGPSMASGGWTENTNYWNKTDNLSIPSDGQNCFTITNWGGGTWSTYDATYTYYLSGTMNSWGKTELTGTGTVSAELELSAGTYTFKIIKAGDQSGTESWYGNNGSFDDTCSGWTMSTSENNCTLNASGGIYTFSLDTSTEKLSVSFACSHPSYDTVVTPPTCTTDGYTTHTCSVCKDSYVTDTVKSPGHNYDPLNGKCTVCGEWEDRAYLMGSVATGDPDNEDWANGLRMDKNGSTYTATVHLNAGTYVFNFRIGTDWYGAQSEFTDKTGTTWDLRKNNNENTTINATGGSYTFTFDPDKLTMDVTFSACEHKNHDQDGVCIDCGTKDVHTWVAGAVTAPTCSAQGYTTYSCTCGATKQDNVTEIVRHHYVNGTCDMCGISMPVVYLSGQMNSWAMTGMKGDADGIYTLKLTLTKGEYEFQIVQDGTWLGKSASFTDQTADWLMEQGSYNNSTIQATGGEYTFTFDSYTHKLTVSYAACTHPAHDTDGKCLICEAQVGHKYDQEVVVPSTCLDEGYTVGYCSCGASQLVAGSTTAMGDHNIVDGVCTVCGMEAGYYLAGDMNKWSAVKMTDDGDVASVTVHLNVGEYKFKVIYRTASDQWLGNTGTITDTASGWTMDASKGDCTIKATKGGEYTFTIDKTTNKLTVTVEECPHDEHDTDAHCLACNAKVVHTYDNTGVCVCGAVQGKKVIFFDATLSKLSYDGSQAVNDLQSIPVANGSEAGDKVFVHYWNETTNASGKLEMTRQPATTINGHTYEDVWRVEIPDFATHVIFYSGANINDMPAYGSGKTIDLGLLDTGSCFYADSSDPSIYDEDGNPSRDGYWGRPYNVRDPELMTGQDTVAIPSGEYQPELDKIYFNATFYDYFTDFELNGDDRAEYGEWVGSNYRSYYIFRHFNQALSTYFETQQMMIPIYVGHFQPDVDGWGYHFKDIADTLKLYGYKDGKAYGSTATDNEKPFMSVNNGATDLNGYNSNYAGSAAQGIVDSTLSGSGELLSSGVVMPFFNEAFLTGDNSKNAVIGQVYEGVKFPFTKQKIDGIYYWVFDSSETTLQLKSDSNEGYFLDEVTGADRDKYWNMDSGNTKQDSYGFFPFNDGATPYNAGTYNYGFGTRMDLTFDLAENGMLQDEYGNYHETVFEFSGDDDLWIFIDGQLILDIGGSHGKVSGTINFATMTATVDSVKSSGASSTAGTNVKKSFTLKDNRSGEHTLTMFYMERGMWESNMRVTFNFTPKSDSLPSTTTYTVKKEWSVQDESKIQSVQVVLQRRAGTGAWENVGEAVTLSAANGWTYTFNGVEKYTDATKTTEYEFRAAELYNGVALNHGEAGGNDLYVTYGFSGNSATGYTQRIVNHEISVQKVVIDFGLPVEIDVFQGFATGEPYKTGTIIGVGNPNLITDGISTQPDGDLVQTYQGRYGTATIVNGKLRYTPNSMSMITPELISFTVQYEVNGVTYYYNASVMVIPAANIYYEDSFLKFTDSTAVNGGYGTWSDATTDNGKTQAEDRPGAGNIYGYDPAYATYKTYSLGAGRKVTVDETSGSYGNAPKATFSFTGTGFDVIGVTDSDSGLIWVEVKQSGKVIKSYVVNTYYGMAYNASTGMWDVKADASDCLYQVPVIKITDLPYGSYDVNIRAAYMGSMDVKDVGYYTIWVDAIRIYDPAKGNTTAEDAYAQDGETAPHFTPVKELLVDPDSFTGGAAVNGVIFVDGKSSGVTIEEYANQGPNNETYLQNGNGIAFKLRYSGSAVPNVSLQIGAKLASGNSATMKYNGNTRTLTTATNMFYELGDVTWSYNSATGYYETVPIVISCSSSGGILSLTDIKVTGADASKIQGIQTTRSASVESLVAFVDTDVINYAQNELAVPTEDIKFQISKDTTGASATTDLRLITHVDSLDYASVTFQVTVGDKTVDLACNNAFSAIVADDTVISDASAVFGGDAKYFITATISDIPAAAFESEIVVTVVWETLDGQLIYGQARTIVIAERLA